MKDSLRHTQGAVDPKMIVEAVNGHLEPWYREWLAPDALGA
jgi:hypothetical protein